MLTVAALDPKLASMNQGLDMLRGDYQDYTTLPLRKDSAPEFPFYTQNCAT